MASSLLLLMALASSVLGAPSGVPVMQLSAQDSISDDPYDDGITIIAEPLPYQTQESDPSNTPNFRWGHLQQGLTSNYPYSWYQPTNTAGGGLLQDHLGNKVYFSNLNQLFQNLPSFPLTFNVPNAANNVGSHFSNSINRFQQFFSQAQQNAAQLAASVQNVKGDEYYQYGTPSHSGLLSQLLHLRPGGSYFKTAARPEAEPYAQMPVYQVIAVMPLYDSPPIRVTDYLRQRSMNFDKPQAEEQISELGSVVESLLEKEVAKEMNKDMSKVAEIDEKDVTNFAKDVAKEVASAVAAAAQKPGKVTEVVVRVDAINVDDDDDDDSSSSSSSEEDDGKVPHASDKKKAEKKKNDHKDDDDSDSSDSSESSESRETPTTSVVPPKKVTPQRKEEEKKKATLREDEVEGGQSEEDDSDEMDSVEKVAMVSKGARPVKAELEHSPLRGAPLSKGSTVSTRKTE